MTVPAVEFLVTGDEVLDGGDDLMTDSAYTTLSRQGFNNVFILHQDVTNQ